MPDDDDQPETPETPETPEAEDAEIVDVPEEQLDAALNAAGSPEAAAGVAALAFGARMARLGLEVAAASLPKSESLPANVQVALKLGRLLTSPDKADAVEATETDDDVISLAASVKNAALDEG